MIVNDIKVSIDYDTNEIKESVSKKLKVSKHRISDIDIIRRSIDARYSNVRFSLSVNARIDGEEDTPELHTFILPDKKFSLKTPPVIIGAGPAGLFAGLILASCGCAPVIIERGKPIDERKKDIEIFQSKSILNTNSNICFGEGGAGTYSDGKLVTRNNDVRSKYIINEFVKFGASKDILLDAKPHIGTDVLSNILINLRNEIIQEGGSIHFEEQMTDIIIENHAVKGILTNKREIKTNQVILAIGHSARDTYENIINSGILTEAKGFALGVRIEHPRYVIDNGMYGKYSNHPRLGAAYYNLKGKFAGQNVYSFCMCPGGEVVNSSTENGALCINGMSYNARAGANSNAAIVCQVNPNLWDNNVLYGIDYQRKFEKICYETGGNNYLAPVQAFGDFVSGDITKGFAEVKPSIKPGTCMADLNVILGNSISNAVKSAISYWDKIIDGYSMNSAVLTAIESRTSSPVRIVRDKSLQSVSLKGLYPCGEGAGYAGGIMSAAIDGIKCADALMNNIE